MSKDYVYDLEVFPNIFTAVFACDVDKKMWVFEISDRKDDSVRLRKFLTERYKNKDTLVGFNNLGFDSPLLHYWLANKGLTSDDMYRYAQEIIESFNSEDRFKYQLSKSKEWLRQLDLYKINHFDNKARATSLKLLEINMRSKNVSDLPYPVGSTLTFDQMDELISYNKHDVLETLKFYKLCEKDIKFRQVLNERYGIDFTNFNDTKIGKQYFQTQLEKHDPEACYVQTKHGRKIRQTPRKKIDLSEVVFDYIQFERPEFQAVLNWIKSRTITETKGVFSDIEEHELGDVAKYANMLVKKKKIKMVNAADKDTAKELRKRMKDESLTAEEVEQLRDQVCGEPCPKMIAELTKLYPLGWVEREVLKSGKTTYNFKWRVVETLNVVVDGFQYDYGVGGIHGSVTNQTFYEDDDWVIFDYDVASYYPNLFIANNVYPEHLGQQFVEIYKDVYQQRKSYAKDTPENKAMKLALNGTYGSTNDKFSPFYDPKSTMQITINGQLLLSLFCEMLISVSPNVRVIGANTDGATFYLKREHIDAVKQKVREWEELTQLEMELNPYSMMAISTVNHYLAVYAESGKVKLNGEYEYRRDQLGWHQNQSALIIKEAAVKQIIDGIPVAQTIRNCKDPFDFMLRAKIPRSSRLYLRKDTGDSLQQNTTRYYISKSGGKLIKIMPPLVEGGDEREFAIDKEWTVDICNNADDFNWSKLDYDYYIQQAKKLVEGVGL